VRNRSTGILHVGIDRGSNLGDLAITRVMRSLLSRSAPAETPLQTHSYNLAPKQLGTSTLSRKHFRLYNRMKDNRLIKTIYDLLYIPLRHFSSIVAYWGRARRARCIVIGGGNLLMGLGLVFPVQNLIYTMIGRILGKEVWFLMVGYGPFPATFSRGMTNLALRLSGRVIFRDSLAFENCSIRTKLAKCAFSCDPALLISDVIPAEKRTAGYDVIISVIPYRHPIFLPDWDLEKYRNHIHHMVNLATRIASKYRVLLITTDYLVDIQAAIDIHRLAENIEYIVPETVEELARLIQQTRIVVSSRMHAAIIAFSYAKPVIGLSWQGKIDGLFRDYQLDDLLYGIDEIDSSLDEINRQISRLLDSEETYDRYSRQITQKVNEARVDIGRIIDALPCGKI